MSADAPTGNPDDPPGDGRGVAPAENVDRDRLPSTSVSGVLRESVGRIVADPWLAVPFLVAGVVLTGVDWLRVHDPVPTTAPELVGDVTVGVAYRFYPTGLRAAGTRPAALVDLETGYLAWTLGLELAAFLAVGIAGWLTLSLAMDAGESGGHSTSGDRSGSARFDSVGFDSTRFSSAPFDSARLGPYLGFVVVAHVLVGLFGLLDGLGWLAVVGLVVYAVAAVRLFAAPALVVGGSGVRGAMRRSRWRAVGEGATVFGLVVLFGLGAWLLGSVPVVGPAASTALVAPIHAVATVVFAERTRAA
ncbi:hypothetical protein M0R88_16780 [Halorussus gelatinilyticus]|uniref:Uncharacterized protein n=1 Tax=Halorussus gelatinilyticus TaxID=2937524 RepID=A0A8U0IHH5_9EURY|nr:hypothetical protein [Halorussus gelatinilyticus]UPW00155.1 hypothetical protein M0R88_16780 [Halorussus gelatinilyticus]